MNNYHFDLKTQANHAKTDTTKQTQPNSGDLFQKRKEHESLQETCFQTSLS